MEPGADVEPKFIILAFATGARVGESIARGRASGRRDLQARPSHSEGGAALITALVFLIVITLLSVTSMRSSTVGVRMAVNEEARFMAAQSAQALTEAILATPADTPVIGGPGFSNCTANESGCDINAVSLPSDTLAAEVAANHLSARIERLTPPDKPPPRLVESSIDKFSAATFQVTATYDRTSDALGRAQVSEGLLVLVPNP